MAEPDTAAVPFRDTFPVIIAAEPADEARSPRAMVIPSPQNLFCCILFLLGGLCELS